MYLVIDSTNRIVDITLSANYARRQENGIIVSCDKAEADAIYSAATDHFYSLRRIDFVSEAYSLVWVEEIPDGVVPKFYHYYRGEFYITEEDEAELAKPTPEEELAALKEHNAALEAQLTDTQLALCDVYETMTAALEVV